MSNTTFVSIKRLPNLKELALPSYATIHSAGMDLVAAIDEDIILKPLERRAIPTGISIALPEGYEAQVRPRSGLALKNGISVPNAPGTIDADYRGEVCAILINLSDQDFKIERGMRIAQMVIAKYSRVNWNIVENLDETERGAGGFGSTGVSSIKAA
ncbi:MAG: dUTP diphosphatase [Candidatus Jidaibacter sp.]|jgi:dUTP pyrophosphatase|nr:dUTP diphosphatase [Candidatus Jidaibacter sp.]